MYTKVKQYILNLIKFFLYYKKIYVPPKKFLTDIFFAIDSILADKTIGH